MPDHDRMALGLTEISDPEAITLGDSFTRGTLIGTAEGDRPIESLQVGDLVHTRDAGLKPIRWIGHRRVRGMGALAPVCIDAGTLGNRRRLTIAPQHRLLIGGWRAELLFGQEEVLVAARHLADGDRIFTAPADVVDYWHILFDAHQIVMAEGIPAESFHPGEHSLSALDHVLREEVFTLLPALRQRPDSAYGPPARPCLTEPEARTLALTA